MALGDADLDLFLRDFGVDVTVGAVTVRGIRDAPEVEMLGQTSPDLIGKLVVVRVKSGALALASKGDITVDGVAHKIHSFAAVGDGKYTRVEAVLVN